SSAIPSRPLVWIALTGMKPTMRVERVVGSQTLIAPSRSMKNTRPSAATSRACARVTRSSSTVRRKFEVARAVAASTGVEGATGDAGVVAPDVAANGGWDDGTTPTPSVVVRVGAQAAMPMVARSADAARNRWRVIGGRSVSRLRVVGTRDPGGAFASPVAAGARAVKGRWWELER